MGYTSDEFPLVGELGIYGRPNNYIVGGFSGHGMPRIWSSGKYISDLIIDKPESDITHIPSTFKIDENRMAESKFEFIEKLDAEDKQNPRAFKL
ncbi:unnamed protein product [Ambrosiozyma monospora]|nr:unnamed protein product [Ambrosiozyma monospora]